MLPPWPRRAKAAALGVPLAQDGGDVGLGLGAVSHQLDRERQAVEPARAASASAGSVAIAARRRSRGTGRAPASAGRGSTIRGRQSATPGSSKPRNETTRPMPGSSARRAKACSASARSASQGVSALSSTSRVGASRSAAARSAAGCAPGSTASSRAIGPIDADLVADVLKAARTGGGRRTRAATAPSTQRRDRVAWSCRCRPGRGRLSAAARRRASRHELVEIGVAADEAAARRECRRERHAAAAECRRHRQTACGRARLRPSAARRRRCDDRAAGLALPARPTAASGFRSLCLVLGQDLVRGRAARASRSTQSQ